ARPAPAAEAPRAAQTGSPAELLKSVEEVQRKEVAALKAMVELLIEKGVFSREEYLAKVKR
ncbi:general secretion pathway protein GspE, partial [Corallococcus sp. CA053C]